MSKNITEKNKFEGGKTRIQSLKDRIDIAFETLRNLYDESKLEKINKKEKRPSKTKIIQYDLEEVANKIVSKEGTVNLKTLEAKIMPTDENNIEESKEQLNTKEIEINSPFINRMQFILNELNQKLLDSQKEKNEYVKKLESEVVNQRISLEELKKAENEHLLKISAYEDQIRILKSKVFGYDISKKYEYFKEHESLNNNQNAHIQDDNLAFSMWEKENYGERKAPSSLNKLENEKQMWISNAQNNINKLENDVKLANSYRGERNFAMNNDEDNGLWTKTPEEARLKSKNNGFNNYGNKYNRNNNQGESNLGNMRRIAPMIMNNKNNY